MITNQVYLTEPRIAIAASAWDAYRAFREELTDAEAQQKIKTLHTAHVRRMMAADQLSGDGAVIITDIPHFDLALVDAHFPAKGERQVTLFSRKGAEFIIGVLARRGLSVPQVQ